MRFDVVEAFSEGKEGPDFPEINDDCYVEISHFSGVIDGVSGPEGRAAMQVVRDVLSALPATATERDFAARIAAAMLDRFGSPKADRRLPGAVGAILSHARREVWVYGDPQVVIVHDNGHHDLHLPRLPASEATFEITRRWINTIYLASGEITTEDLYHRDPYMEVFGPVLDRQHALANNPDTDLAYSLLCAKPVPDNLAMVIELPNTVREIILMSDGYPVQPMLDTRDYATLVQIEARLADINARDPHCMGLNLSMKGIMFNIHTHKLNVNYDDRTYVRIRVHHT